MNENKVEELGDALCVFCPWTKGEISRRCDSVCEGRYCEDALESYNEQHEDEKI